MLDSWEITYHPEIDLYRFHDASERFDVPSKDFTLTGEIISNRNINANYQMFHFIRVVMSITEEELEMRLEAAKKLKQTTDQILTAKLIEI